MSAPDRSGPGPWITWLARLVIAFLIVPTLIIVPAVAERRPVSCTSRRASCRLRWYANFWSDGAWLQSAAEAC